VAAKLRTDRGFHFKEKNGADGSTGVKNTEHNILPPASFKTAYRG